MVLKQHEVLLLLVLILSFIDVFPAQAPCPGGAAAPTTTYTITTARNYTVFIWVRPADGQYVVTCNPTCSPIAGYSATMDATHSTLTIDSVWMIDAGTWVMEDADGASTASHDVCQLSISDIATASSDTPTSFETRTRSDNTTPPVSPSTSEGSSLGLALGLGLTLPVVGVICIVIAVYFVRKHC